MGYTGVAMVEFKKNIETGDWVFIEVNTRFWGSLPLAVASGANFPLALFEMVVDGRTSFGQDYQRGLRCRYWRSDLRWHLSNHRADRRDRSLNSLPSGRVIMDLCSALGSGNERSDTYTADDLAPARAELKQIFNDARDYVARSLSLFVHWVPWLARARRARTVKRFRAARSVLFVCKGNICRSPFAALLAKSLLPPGRIIRSAGYLPAAFRPAPPKAIEAARRWSIDLDSHRSQHLNGKLVHEADIIFVFDEYNDRALRDTYPAAARRMYYLGELLTSGPMLISDPMDDRLAGIDECYARIARAIQSACL